MAIAVAVPAAEKKPEPADAIAGTWLTAGNDARVKIVKEVKKVKEGKTEKTVVKYNGNICWIIEPNYEDGDPEAGKPRRDRNNPDEAMQKKPLVGLAMLKSFDYVSENKWAGGTIYDPENGRTYKCEIAMVMPEKPKDPKAPMPPVTLNVRGYLGVPAFGRTTVWKRYTPPKKDEAEKAKEPAKTE
ncbi:MAG: DUF2147 domain-containing protein [bacterium]|nr:DUF2147 domain-containing protein [bacterium]